MSQQRSPLFRYAAAAITLIAGAYTLFHIFWAHSGHTADDFWGQTLLVLFVLGVILAFAVFAQERQALVANAPKEQFPEPAIARFFFGSSGSAPMWFVVRMNVGAQWLLAGWEKVQTGFNGAAIKGFAAGGVSKATGAYPSVQGWYASFLKDFVIPHSGAWAFAITYGELAVGLGVLLGALTGIAAGFGVLMNLNYLLAGTVSINPVLGMFGLFLVFSWRVCGFLGLDYYLLPAIGLPWKPGSLFPSAQPTKVGVK
jgi:thiosulfate dehydrogenase [quinone] large subunit